MQCRGSRAAPDGVLDTAIGGKGALELCHRAPEHELPRFQDIDNRCVNLGLDRPILNMKVEERDHRGSYRERDMMRPWLRTDSSAASRSLTTRYPAWPEVAGVIPRMMQSLACVAATISASEESS